MSDLAIWHTRQEPQDIAGKDVFDQVERLNLD